MIRKIFTLVLGAFLLFLFTNIFFPQIFQNTVLASVSRSLSLRSQNCNFCHFVVSADSNLNDPAIVSQIQQFLGRQTFSYDQKGNLVLFSESEYSYNAEQTGLLPMLFVPYEKDKVRPGHRIVEAVIKTKNEKGLYPVGLTIFTLQSDGRLEPMCSQTQLHFNAGQTESQTAENAAELIVTACLF
jgi:hypothetical protein